MPTNDTTDYATEGSTQTLQSLAQKAGNDTREEALAAKDTTPVSKLTYTASCREVTEYYTTHHKVSRKYNITLPQLMNQTDFLHRKHCRLPKD